MNKMRPMALALLLSVAACSGGGGAGTALPTGSTPAQVGGGTTPATAAASAKLTVTIPSATTTSSSSVKRPMYVSPSSAQMTVAVNGGSPATYGLTAQSPGCSLVTGNLNCVFTIAAAAGSDSFAITLEDASGHALSENTVGATLAAGTTTAVNVTLAGVPASVAIIPTATSGIEGSATPAYHFPGLLPQPIRLQILDADGNIIIGPGAPTLGAPPSVTGGTTYATVYSAQDGNSNDFILAPTGVAAGGQTVTVSASAQQLGTTTPVTSTTNFTFTPALVVGSGPLVTEYSMETGKTIASFQPCAGCSVTIIKGIVNDASGNLYIGYQQIVGLGGGGGVLKYSPTSTTATARITAGITSPAGLTMDKNGMLYVVNAPSGFGLTRKKGTVAEYLPNTTIPKYTITDSTGAYIISPMGVAVDTNGNVFVPTMNGSPAQIQEYLSGSRTAPTATIQDGSLQAPVGIAIDASNNLYVSDQTNNYIAYYPAGTTTATSLIRDPAGSFSNGLQQIHFDSSGNLWVSMNAGTNLTEVLQGSALPSTVTVIQPTYHASGYVTTIP